MSREILSLKNKGWCYGWERELEWHCSFEVHPIDAYFSLAPTTVGGQGISTRCSELDMGRNSPNP
jgi:hypothetical protein